MRHLLIVFGLVCLLGTSGLAIETEAPQAYLVDFETGEVLFDKNGEQLMAPSSMSKIMTVYVVFERLKNGDIKLEDTLPVSQEAWKMGGSKMFVQLNSQVSIDDLLKGTIVQSGNDACLVLAEGLAGTETAFAEELTQKAQAMGAHNTTFVNATGWPNEDHLTTAKDLAIIAERTIRDFPEKYKKYYAIKEFTHNGIKQGNRNTLLYKNMADGMKTGHTEAGGYGIVASAKEGDRRLIYVGNGFLSSKSRDQGATALLKWGFSHFKNYKLFKKGDVVEVADVWGGSEKSVPLIVSEDVIFTIPRNQRKNLEAKVIYNTPLPAPLKEGDEVGVIEVIVPEKGSQKIPLYAGKSVEKAGFIQRISNSIHYLLWGKHSS